MKKNLSVAEVGAGMGGLAVAATLQRVGIAQAIIHDPKLVFLDEPMSGLDPVGRREVRDLIQGLKDEGKTVFFSTHILSDVETLCDRVCILRNGTIIVINIIIIRPSEGVPPIIKPPKRTEWCINPAGKVMPCPPGNPPPFRHIGEEDDDNEKD